MHLVLALRITFLPPDIENEIPVRSNMVTSLKEMLVIANHFQTFPSELFSDYLLLKRIQIGGYEGYAF